MQKLLTEKEAYLLLLHNEIGNFVNSMAGNKTQKTFDVFLCHNTIDKPQVRLIAEQLQSNGLTPWFDEWEARPGFPWLDVLQEQIAQVKAAAVFIGANGIAPWQQMTIDALLREFAYRQCPVIPVILTGTLETPQLPAFLEGITWVDFRDSQPDPMQQLQWGITGKRSSSLVADHFDAFLSYTPHDMEWVEMLAHALIEQVGLHIWLDKWELIPGRSWQQAVARNMEQATSHVVCIGGQTPSGWFERQIEHALNRQALEPSLRVIPILLPGVHDVCLNSFLDLNIPVDFRIIDQAYAFYLLVCGIKGIAPGRWPLTRRNHP